MSFFKKLFSKGEPAKNSEHFIPTPSQQVPGIEPIVLQAIENLFPNTDDRKKVIEFSIRYKKYQKADTLRLLLSLFAYSNGDIEKLLATEPDAIHSYQFMLDEIAPRFTDLKDAEKWVKSITKPRV